MQRRRTIWTDAKADRAKTGDPEDRGKNVFFGYEKIPSAKKGARVIRHFETVSRRYDIMNTILSFGIHHLWKRTAIKMLAIKPGDRIIDVCGGTGDLATLAAAGAGPNGRVFLYDINRAMMEAGRRKVAASPHGSNIVLVQGDAERIAFPDGSFDGAMVGFGIRNLTRPEKGFEELHRVLKKGGKMMCLEFSKPTAPLFRRLYDLYSFHVMPWLGQVIAGSRQAYTHLPESIRTFPLPPEIIRTLNRIGFSDIHFRKLTNGIAVIYVAMKSRGDFIPGMARTWAQEGPTPGARGD
jgi:demethylmenaquinone methyltransferase/2-methoxy-6-polyprenyl-1,4-benzoquinol methylase